MDISFKPHHINATHDDFQGNEGIGRYILLPGSEGRAQEIAEHFDRVRTKHHPRGHNLYLGTIQSGKHSIEVATISSGMGCSSMEIIIHELFQLGAKRFLRVGTAGSLQQGIINVGSIVNVQASIRDEGTTSDYAPIEFPAIASLEFVTSILVAAENLDFNDLLYTGIVHCKSSLYASEFFAGPRATENEAYLHSLTQLGTLATEMETSTLFIQSQIYNYQLTEEDNSAKNRVLAGAILAIVGGINEWDSSPNAAVAVNDSIELALESIKVLANQELLD